MRLYWAVLGSLLIAGAAAAQPAAPARQPAASPAAQPARPPAAAPADPVRALEDEIHGGCFRDFTLPTLSARVAALGAAGHDDASITRGAPDTMMALALLYRQAGDFTNADRIYSRLVGALPQDDQRAVRARSAMHDEQALLAAGATRPEPGALLVDWRDAPGEGGPYHLGLWSKPDCSALAAYDGLSILVLYRQNGSGFAPVGEPVKSDGSTFLFETDGWASDMTGDGRRLLPITEANGGNCGECSHLRLFVASATGLSELATGAPDFVIPVRLARIADRGVLVGFDARWETFGDVCHACAPGVGVVLGWRSGHFEQICREVPDFYRERLGELRSGLADRDPQYRFGAITSRLLNRIQMGEADAAWTEYRRALGALRQLRGGPRDGFRGAENELATALRNARPQLASAACPVSALSFR
jgi:hypothetical protein